MEVSDSHNFVAPNDYSYSKQLNDLEKNRRSLMKLFKTVVESQTVDSFAGGWKASMSGITSTNNVLKQIDAMFDMLPDRKYPNGNYNSMSWHEKAFSKEKDELKKHSSKHVQGLGKLMHSQFECENSERLMKAVFGGY